MNDLKDFQREKGFKRVELLLNKMAATYKYISLYSSPAYATCLLANFPEIKISFLKCGLESKIRETKKIENIDE